MSYIRYGAPKRIVIVLWCFSSSFILWYFALSFKPQIEFLQYMNFFALLFGGGVAYDIVAKLSACPYTQNNKALWWDVFKGLFLVYLGYLVLFGCLYIATITGGPEGWIIAFLTLLFCSWWIIQFKAKLEKPIKKLLHSPNKIGYLDE